MTKMSLTGLLPCESNVHSAISVSREMSRGDGEKEAIKPMKSVREHVMCCTCTS